MRIVANTAANFVAAFTGPILAIALTPFYIRHIGLEGYGLIGFFATLTILLNVFCAGVGKVYLSRIAALTGAPATAGTAPSLYKVFLTLYFCLGLVTAGAIASLSWWVSHRWLKLETLTPESAQLCILLISFSIMVSFPAGVCTNTLFALQEQVLMNGISIGCTLASNAAAVFLVYRYESVLGYYAATASGSLLALLFLAWAARRALNRVSTAHWPNLISAFRQSWNSSTRILRSSLALIWTEIVGVIVTQSDRLLLTSLMPIASLGIYNTGTALARPILMGCNPFLNAAFPNLCQLAAGENGHSSATRDASRQQIVILAIVASICVPFCAIPETILNLWLKNPDIARQAAPVVVLYSIANALLGLAGAPYNLAVAVDKTRYAAIWNSAALIWYPALGYFLISQYHLVGAAILWFTYCLSAMAGATLIAVLFIDRAYVSLRNVGVAGAIVSLSLLTVISIRTIPEPWIPFRILAACAASLLVLFSGFLMIFGKESLFRTASSVLSRIFMQTQSNAISIK